MSRLPYWHPPPMRMEGRCRRGCPLPRGWKGIAVRAVGSHARGGSLPWRQVVSTVVDGHRRSGSPFP